MLITMEESSFATEMRRRKVAKSLVTRRETRRRGEWRRQENWLSGPHGEVLSQDDYWRLEVEQRQKFCGETKQKELVFTCQSSRRQDEDTAELTVRGVEVS